MFVLQSEIGAGAIPGWQDPMNGFWTINYQVHSDNIESWVAVERIVFCFKQAEVLKVVTSTIVSNPSITGTIGNEIVTCL